ncbi:MAG: arginine repressor [Actinobacteria bacterium]|nr:arginine repressor [Actinomycetota bacterium]
MSSVLRRHSSSQSGRSLNLPEHSPKFVRRFTVAKKSTLSTNARRALVISYVNQGLVHSQNDLVELLRDEGIDVTQATASRDLEEIGAVRGRDQGGLLRYQFLTESNENRSRFSRASEELVLSIVASGNLVVLKTPAGGAQLLASALDRAAANGRLATLIGTIAGDDTVLAISKSANGGKSLSQQLTNFINGNQKSISKGVR